MGEFDFYLLFSVCFSNTKNFLSTIKYKCVWITFKHPLDNLLSFVSAHDILRIYVKADCTVLQDCEFLMLYIWKFREEKHTTISRFVLVSI